MDGFSHDIALRLVKLLDVVLLAIPVAFGWYFCYANWSFPQYSLSGMWMLTVLFVVIYCTYGRIYDAFVVSLNRISEMVYSQSLAALISDALLYFVIWLVNRRLPSVLPMLGILAVQILLAAMWSYSAHQWYFKVFPPKRTVLIYDSLHDMDTLIREYGMDKKFRIEGTASVESCISQDMAILDGIEAVFLCGAHSHDRNIILKYCVANGITLYMLPRIGDTIMSGAKKIHMFHLPMLRVGRYNPPPEYLFLKRLFDIVSSGTVLLLLSPIMVITAVAIKATDGGPVFYRQRRLTKDGKCFDVLKFRSMRVDAEKDGIARLSTGDKDDRITPVGRIIRKVRIDELPQLLNILQGSMSVVGPRPERPEIAAQYEAELPEFALRLQAKAGLTGYAQVYGQYNTTPYDKLQMDLMYIANPSFWEDIRICFATVKILFMPESTEGIAEGATTAMSGGNNG